MSRPAGGQALAGWNFTVTMQPDGSSDLRLETRVWCAPDVRWKFQVYWLVVRPGSGLIRQARLRAIRRQAEAAGRTGGAPGNRRPASQETSQRQSQDTAGERTSPVSRLTSSKPSVAARCCSRRSTRVRCWRS